MIQTFPQTASVHQLQKGYRSLLNQVKKAKKPLFLLKNNKPEGVIVDFNFWQKLVRKWTSKDLGAYALNSIHWQRLRKDLEYLSKMGKKDVDLSKFVIHDRERH